MLLQCLQRVLNDCSYTVIVKIYTKERHCYYLQKGKESVHLSQLAPMANQNKHTHTPNLKAFMFATDTDFLLHQYNK